MHGDLFPDREAPDEQILLLNVAGDADDVPADLVAVDTNLPVHLET